MHIASTGRQAPGLLAACALACAAAVLLLIVSLRVEHSRPTRLPAPTGPYPVAKTSYDWTHADIDSLAPARAARREVVVRVWYPAAADDSLAHEYLPRVLRAAVDRARGPVIAGLLTRDLSKVYDPAAVNAPIATATEPYPVVILRAGASAEVWNYSVLAEDLASHGYVVVGVDAPYRTNVVVTSDGRVLRRTPTNDPERALDAPDSAARINAILGAWTGDVGFVLDRLQHLNAPGSADKFAGRLDLSRVGVLGHSLGGATAADFCAQDARCRAGIDIDGAPVGSVVQSGLHRPFMFLLSDHGRGSDGNKDPIMTDIQSIYARLAPQNGVLLEIRGGNHFLFGDDGALLKSHLVLAMLRLFRVIHIDGPRQLAVTAFAVHSFFDARLKRGGVATAGISSPSFPELQPVR